MQGQGTEYLHYQNLASGGRIDLMLDAITGESELRQPVRPSQYTLAIQADAAGIVFEVKAGNRTVIPRSTMDLGGTDGQFPDPRILGVSFLVAAFETVKIICEETAAAATTDIMAVVSATPVR